jgi:hypothetical protein
MSKDTHTQPKPKVDKAALDASIKEKEKAKATGKIVKK